MMVYKPCSLYLTRLFVQVWPFLEKGLVPADGGVAGVPLGVTCLPLYTFLFLLFQLFLLQLVRRGLPPTKSSCWAPALLQVVKSGHGPIPLTVTN